MIIYITNILVVHHWSFCQPSCRVMVCKYIFCFSKEIQFHTKMVGIEQFCVHDRNRIGKNNPMRHLTHV